MIHWSISPGGWSGVRVRSSRWALVAGAGSAERSGEKYWPGWRRRSSASAATASWRWARVACLPVGAVGHRLGEHRLALPVGPLQGLVAGGQLVLGRGVVVVAALLCGAGLGGGAQAGQAGVPGGGADLAQLVADVLGGPGGLDGVGVAQVQQPAVRHAADVRAVGRAEGGQGLVPGGAGVGGGRDRFGADRVGRVVIAG